MTARVKSVGVLTFSHTLWGDEYEKPSHIVGEMRRSAAGTHIVYEAEILTPYRTLNSKRHGWLTSEDVAAIKVMYDQLDTTFTLTYDDDSTEIVRFAHEKQPVFTPITEAAKYYTVVIPLAKV